MPCSYLFACTLVDAHVNWLTATQTRKFDFCPHFSCPPFHLFNFLALPLSSSPGQSLAERLLESRSSLPVSLCVRECVQAPGRASRGRYVCAVALPSRHPPILPGYFSDSGPRSASWLVDFQINPRRSVSDKSVFPTSLSRSLSYLLHYFSRSLLTRDYIR